MINVFAYADRTNNHFRSEAALFLYQPIATSAQNFTKRKKVGLRTRVIRYDSYLKSLTFFIIFMIVSSISSTSKLQFRILPASEPISESLFTVAVSSTLLRLALVQNAKTVAIFTVAKERRIGFRLLFAHSVAAAVNLNNIEYYIKPSNELWISVSPCLPIFWQNHHVKPLP